MGFHGWPLASDYFVFLPLASLFSVVRARCSQLRLLSRIQDQRSGPHCQGLIHARSTHAPPPLVPLHCLAVLTHQVIRITIRCWVCPVMPQKKILKKLSESWRRNIILTATRETKKKKKCSKRSQRPTMYCLI